MNIAIRYLENKNTDKQKPFRNMGSSRKGFLCVIYYYIGESNNT